MFQHIHEYRIAHTSLWMLIIQNIKIDIFQQVYQMILAQMHEKDVKGLDIISSKIFNHSTSQSQVALRLSSTKARLRHSITDTVIFLTTSLLYSPDIDSVYILLRTVHDPISYLCAILVCLYPIIFQLTSSQYSLDTEEHSHKNQLKYWCTHFILTILIFNIHRNFSKTRNSSHNWSFFGHPKNCHFWLIFVNTSFTICP